MANLSAHPFAHDVLQLSGQTWAAIAIAVVAAATFAAWQVLISILNERKRTQPVVIAHDAGGRQFGDQANPNTVLPTFLTNEGGGNAFNVRFGVDFEGVRHARKFFDEDRDHGSYQRVVRLGARLPENWSSFNIEKTMAAEAQAAQEAAVVEGDERALPSLAGQAKETEEQPGD